MKKVLIMVMSSDKQPWKPLGEASMKTWDTIHVNGVETVFYAGCPKNGGISGSSEQLYLLEPDTLTNGGKITVHAFEWALQRKDFDYILRVNASTFVNKKLVFDYVQDKPETNLYMGVGAPYSLPQKDFLYAWGPHYLLSKDVVQLIVDNKDKWNHGLMDDVALGLLMNDLGIPLNNKGSMASIDAKNKTFLSYNNNDSGGGSYTDLSELAHLPLIRVKQDYDRTEDIRLMHELFNVIKK